MLCSLVLHCLLAPWLHVCCWHTLHVTHMVCSPRLSASVTWSLFNGLAGGAYLAGIHCVMHCAWFVAWHCNACLLHIHEFVVVLLNLFPSCGVGPCCAFHQWPALIALAARECANRCMVDIVSCFMHGLWLAIAMHACSTAACLLLCCSTWLTCFVAPWCAFHQGHVVNGLVARECVEVCMAEVVSCILHAL